MINFDNAATTFPKPRSVRQAMEMAMLKYGGNAGRGGHQLTERTSEQVFAAREEAAAFFGGKPENTIFCLNCTHALNLAIQGIVQPNDHVIISNLEHNAVLRPVAAMVRERGYNAVSLRFPSMTRKQLLHFGHAFAPIPEP